MNKNIHLWYAELRGAMGAVTERYPVHLASMDLDHALEHKGRWPALLQHTHWPSHTRQKQAHAASRICALTACKSMGFTLLEIQKNHFGAPMPLGRGNAVHLSIAHSRMQAWALATDSSLPIALDIEHSTPMRNATAARYHSPAENAMAFDVAGTDGPILLWTLKESLSKALGLGMRLQRSAWEIKSLEATEGGWMARFSQFAPFRAWCGKLDGEFVAIAFPADLTFVPPQRIYPENPL
jgi:4'-phosphopantetheinyl transferase EntD